MRAMTEGLPSPHPIGRLLPGIYLEDDFVQKLTEGLDAVLAPLLSTLDNLDSYIDPDLTPSDFVTWLSGWVGLLRDPAESVDGRRAMIKEIVEIYRRRGTGHGLRDHIAVAFGVVPELIETGGVSWSRQPRSPLPGLAEPELIVRISVDEPSKFDREGLNRFVEQNKPAHVPHRIELLPLEGAPVPPEGKGSPPPAEPDGEAARSGDGQPSRVPRPARSPYRGYGPVRAGD
jgi:phage tail-like protein